MSASTATIEYETMRDNPHAAEQRMHSDAESTFGIDELFFSTTDKSGRITTGNSIFRRVAKYDMHEMIGRPHNLVRHVDMPRCVFRVLWDHLDSGSAVAAYVKNRAKDGSWYWVFAYAVPVGDEYLSVRMKPTSDYFSVIKELYATLRECEREIENNQLTRFDGDRKLARNAAVQASLAEVQMQLHTLDFASYDAFMHAALTAEVLSRDAILQHTEATNLEIASFASSDEHDTSTTWLPLANAYENMRQLLNGYMARVEYFEKSDRLLSSKSEFLGGLAENIRIFALNAILSCDAITSGSNTLAAVASLMRDRSNTISTSIARLRQTLEQFSIAIEQIGFCIASSRLQTDLATQYVRQAIQGTEDGDDIVRNLRMLARSEVDANTPIRKWLAELIRRSHEIAGYVNEIQRELGVLQVLHVNGRVECAAVRNNHSIVALFEHIGEQVQHAQSEMSEFVLVEDFFQLEKLSRDGLHSKLLEVVVEETKKL